MSAVENQVKVNKRPTVTRNKLRANKKAKQGRPFPILSPTQGHKKLDMSTGENQAKVSKRPTINGDKLRVKKAKQGTSFDQNANIKMKVRKAQVNAKTECYGTVRKTEYSAGKLKLKSKNRKPQMKCGDPEHELEEKFSIPRRYFSRL